METIIYSLTSPLHAEVMAEACEERFIKDIEAALGEDFIFRGEHCEEYGMAAGDKLELLYVRTGGTEGVFQEKVRISGKPVYLLTSGKSNSLAASMEILSFLRDAGVQGEILHGSTEEICSRIKSLQEESACKAEEDAREIEGVVKIDDALCAKLKSLIGGKRIGVVGKPSDWLISSNVDPTIALERLGLEIVEIPIEELIAAVQTHDKSTLPGFSGSQAVYEELKAIAIKYKLQGLTVRCFDLLGPICNTGCLALAKLNAEGIPSSCEGDVPALITMMIANALTGVSGFQCNLSRVERKQGEFLFAHCTVPLNMISSYKRSTHFESGLGTAIKGELPEGPVSIMKISSSLDGIWLRQAEILRNCEEAGLCRTQIIVKAKGAESYLLHRPFGNHHIVVPGHISF